MRVRMGRGVTLALASIAALLAAASPARASITLGQVGDPGISSCFAGNDWVQTGSAGNTYAAPARGTITSWTMSASATANQQVKLKVFRKIGNPATYEAVGHTEASTLTPTGTDGNTFPANIAVKPGDLIGFHSVNAINCLFAQTGGQFGVFSGDLADGNSDVFGINSDAALDVQATLVPDNSFTIAGTTRNKKKGTATITLAVPNPGELTASGNGVKAAGAAVTSKAVGGGQAQLLIKAKGKKKRKLNETGKVKLSVTVTYTPTGGDPATLARKVKLTKKV